MKLKSNNQKTKYIKGKAPINILNQTGNLGKLEKINELNRKISIAAPTKTKTHAYIYDKNNTKLQFRNQMIEQTNSHKLLITDPKYQSS